MSVATIEAYIKNGQIVLPPDANLPDHGQVFIVIPDGRPSPTAHIFSPKLADREQSAYLKKSMVEEKS